MWEDEDLSLSLSGKHFFNKFYLCNQYGLKYIQFDWLHENDQFEVQLTPGGGIRFAWKYDPEVSIKAMRTAMALKKL